MWTPFIVPKNQDDKLITIYKDSIISKVFEGTHSLIGLVFKKANVVEPLAMTLSIPLEQCNQFY